jgi:parvulin-like peptidyl-prolyl isomerase
MSGKDLRRAVVAAAALALLGGASAMAADGDAVLRIGDDTLNATQITQEFTWSAPALLNEVRRNDNSMRLLAIDWYSNKLISRAAVDDKLLDKLPGLANAADALRAKMIAGRVLPKYVSERFKSDDRELKQFMELNDQLCNAPTSYRVARIGVVVGKRASEPEIQAAKARLDTMKKRIEGGESFATVADESSDLSAKAPGGEVGWLTSEELERTEGKEAVTALKKDQTSDVIRTSDGFVVYKLLDRKEARKLTFEECRATLERVMNERYKAQIAKDWIGELAKRYNASLNVDAFAAAVRAVPLDKNWLERQAAKDESGTDVAP